jgi:hypothetical protein
MVEMTTETPVRITIIITTIITITTTIGATVTQLDLGL